MLSETKYKFKKQKICQQITRKLLLHYITAMYKTNVTKLN